MTVFHFPYPLRFSSRDLQPLAPVALASQLRVSQGFVRLCFEAGCPNDGGLASAADLMGWLFDHYESVRATAGLRPLAPVGDVEAVTASRLRMANGLVTLLEYARTRATDWRKKKHLRLALEQMDRLADSAI